MKLSVVICTRNRPDKIGVCIKSILANSFPDFEMIVVDQSDDEESKTNISRIDLKVKYFKIRSKGLSRARNFGVRESRGETIAFTDDDCIVDKEWLSNIYQSFQKNGDIVGIFGKVLPYKSALHKDKVSPCIFLENKGKIITKPCPHWENLGFGNNMAFRKEIFYKIEVFQEWLGVGSLGKSSEDAEFALRVLLSGHKLLYNPKVKVYHNRWLTEEEFRRQCLSYSCGEVACYGYFGFQGLDLGKEVFKDNFLDSFRKLKLGIKSIIFFRKNSFRIIFNAVEELFFRFKGSMVAFWFSKKEPLNLPVSGKD